jgi:dipeptidase E
MKLFLASEAKHPDCMEKLQSFVGGFEGKSVAYIPTAVNGESPYGEWETTSSSWKLINTLGAHVTPVVLEDYKNSTVLSQLEGKDVIWFAGGACGYLMYWIRRCEIDTHIREILDAGSIYVGSSAGSMIAAPNLGITEWYLTESEPGAQIFPGLGLVDFDIYPHYEDDLYDKVVEKHKKGKVYLLKNGEAITSVDGKISVLGEERIVEK